MGGVAEALLLIRLDPTRLGWGCWKGLGLSVRWAGLDGAEGRSGLYVGASRNIRCRLNVIAAQIASHCTRSRPRIANRVSFSLVLIQALGNSANSGALHPLNRETLVECPKDSIATNDVLVGAQRAAEPLLFLSFSSPWRKCNAARR
jgi:hypothetical protein